MFVLNGSCSEVNTIILIKKHDTVLEKVISRVKHIDMFLDVESLQRCLLCYFNFIWLKVQSHTKKNKIAFALATTVVHRDHQALSRIIFLKPEFAMQIWNKWRGNIVASLIPSELPVPIKVDLVRGVANINNPKEIAWQGI
jgi:hypothetical protein